MTSMKDRNVIDYMSYGVMMVTAILGAVTLMSTTGCGSMVDNGKALKAVKDDGYTSATIKDKSVVFPGWSGCDDSDAAEFDVTATNVTGAKVNLTVCCGIIKACTIRH